MYRFVPLLYLTGLLTCEAQTLGQDITTSGACKGFKHYCEAVRDSGVKVVGIGLYAGPKLFVQVPDQLAKRAVLQKVNDLHLDPAPLMLTYAPEDDLPERSHWPNVAQIVIERAPQQDNFTLTVTRRALTSVVYQPKSCEPASIERLSDGVKVWQASTGSCMGVELFPAHLRPGQAISRTVSWDRKNSMNQEVSPGLYRIRMGLGPFVGERIFRIER